MSDKCAKQNSEKSCDEMAGDVTATTCHLPVVPRMYIQQGALGSSWRMSTTRRKLNLKFKEEIELKFLIWFKK